MQIAAQRGAALQIELQIVGLPQHQRLWRTPGSTKDYLSWLEDVDLVFARQKRYSYADPLLRTWVRLYANATPPGEDPELPIGVTALIAPGPAPQPDSRLASLPGRIRPGSEQRPLCPRAAGIA